MLDLDDPDFWQKAVGLEAPPDPAFDELTKLMTDGKRQRKQVQQYDPYAVDKAEEAKKQEKIKELEREEAEEKEIQRTQSLNSLCSPSQRLFVFCLFVCVKVTPPAHLLVSYFITLRYHENS